VLLLLLVECRHILLLIASSTIDSDNIEMLICNDDDSDGSDTSSISLGCAVAIQDVM